MYGYSMQIPLTPAAYRALHQAVADVVEQDGGGDGLLVHLAYPTDGGCILTEVWESKKHLDEFNATLWPKAAALAGVPMEGPPPQPAEFDPIVLMTSRRFNSDDPSLTG